MDVVEQAQRQHDLRLVFIGVAVALLVALLIYVHITRPPK